MNIYVPYTYLIGWTKQNKWYYGVRYARNCNPQDLWKNYFTSSKYVKKFREEHGEPDVIEIRKIFKDSNSAILWETKVIKRMNMVESNIWLNKWDNQNGTFYNKGPMSEDHKIAISKSNKNRIFTDEHRKKMSLAASKRKRSEDHIQKLHEGRRRSTNSPEHIAAIKLNNSGINNPMYGKIPWNKGKKCSEETKIKIRNTKLKNKKGGCG